MSTVGAYEAKTHLPALIERVEAGEEITITRHGMPVARLVPTDQPSAPAAETVAALLSARSGSRLGADVRRLIEEGRA
ncbi:type II toxin-antitoxin system Phd/YefM family antitoxin [Agromyces bracchium]|uniref:Antitoxin n=1 Tax=Agromyces bracchium TaxID=88376 RepID=A0A6I3M3W2_9MICO|nr:type II toxin-antitoxin system prevent-host-death family antitoxin [Agromyces bracchium]MTH67571.1 type II toxin-antitoxin system prevent-host-death family antitoxin [Agromyces bracchium]